MNATSAESRSRSASSHWSRWTELEFLLAFEHVLHVDREAAAGRQHRTGRHDVGMDLALVVGRATGEDPVADDDRLERRRGPQVERVDRLDVVVAVDEDGRGVGGVQPVRVDDRMPAGLDGFRVFEAGRGQGLDQPVGRGPAVVGVARQRGDAGDAKERLVRLEAGVLGLGQVRFEGGVGGGHGPALYGAARVPAGRPWNRTSGPSPARSLSVSLGTPGVRPAAGSRPGPGSAGRARRWSGCRGRSPWPAGR